MAVPAEILNYAIDLAQQLKRSGVSQIFDFSPWVYPFVKLSLHLGLAILYGSLVPMSLRMLGMWRTIPIYDLSQVLVRSSFAGGLLALIAGLLLISPEPERYVRLDVFWWGIGFLLIAWINAALLRIVPAWRYLARVDSRGTIRRFKWTGLISLLSWTGLMACIILPGYFTF